MMTACQWLIGGVMRDGIFAFIQQGMSERPRAARSTKLQIEMNKLGRAC